MTENERATLLHLHRNAIVLWEMARCGEEPWETAYAADDAFGDALMAVQVTP